MNSLNMTHYLQTSEATTNAAAGEDTIPELIELLNNLDPAGGQETPLLVRYIVMLSVYSIDDSYLCGSGVQIPDELTRHVLARAGVTCDDVRTLRLFSLAGQLFLHDIVDEACVVQQNRMQAPLKFQQNEGYPTKDRRPVVLTEDVAVAAREYGMKVYRPQFLNQ